MKYIIDRFEGKWTVCEDENCKMVDIEKSKLPKAFASAMWLCKRTESSGWTKKTH